MPYSDDPDRLEQMLPYLGPLATGDEIVEWTIVKGNANTVAFRIREALVLARKYPLQYVDLARFAGDYAVSVLAGNKVRARRRTPTLHFSQLVPLPPIVPATTPPVVTQGREIDVVAHSLVRMAGTEEIQRFDIRRMDDLLRGPKTPLAVVDIYRQSGRAKPTVRFPEANLTDAELYELFLWAGAQEPPLMLLVDDIALTVAVFDSLMAEYSWRPADGE